MMSKRIRIGKRIIGDDQPPFVVAEMSGNHNQSLARALKIVEAAAEAGADAIKLQTYTADTLTLDSNRDEFLIRDPKSLWKGESLYELYKKAYTPWEWHEPIIQRSRELGLLCFSSPFDKTSVDFLQTLNMPAYKISSFEICHLPLIKQVALTKKPVIVSTGMASIEELEEMVKTVLSAGCEELILLKCTSAYPAPPEDAHLATLKDMKQRFNCEVGISDHTLGIGVSIAAVALGATFIERHFTLSRAEGGVDSAFSLEPHELRSLVEESKKAQLARGETRYGPSKSEEKSIQYRRSVYASQDIAKGERFTDMNIKVIRPGYGLHPKFFSQILGEKSCHSILRATPIRWSDVQNTGKRA